MKKSILAMILLMVCITLAGCGGTQNSGGNTTSSSGSNTSSTGGSENAGETAVSDGTYTNITIPFFSGARLEDMALVEEELNKIAREKVGAEITLLPIDWGAWDQQINLMISGGEKIDLLPVLGENYPTTIGQGKLIPIDEYMNSEFGKALADTVGEVYLNTSKMNGELYGVPSLRDMVRSYGLVFRKDLVEKYNIDINSIKTVEDLDKIFATVKAGEPDMYMVYTQGNWHGLIFQLFNDRDMLGDDYGVLMNRGLDNLTVVNLYASPEYEAYCKKIREWYELGYIPMDATTTPDGGSAFVKNDQLFSYAANLKPGYAMENTNAAGYELVQADFVPPFATTSTITSLMWSVPVTCEDPQKAIDVLSLMYTDPDFVNLIDWGIEGKHYVNVEGSSLIKYPEGISYDNTGWDMNAGWIWGNQLISKVWDGNDENLYTELNKFNQSATLSKALGFQFDSSSVKTEIAAVTNVKDQYRLSLECGVVDPVENLPKFIKALEDAGINRIIEEKQAQLDKWAAENGVK